MDEPVAKRTKSGVADLAAKKELQAQPVYAKASKINVMCNSLLLTKIAGIISAHMLLNLRGTCKTWNSSFIPDLRKKHNPIRLDSSSAEADGNNDEVDDEGNQGNSIKTFIKLMKSSLKIPFANYDITDCDQELETFVTVCGGNLTKLELQWDLDWKQNWETSAIRQAIFGQLPYLTDLNLQFVGGFEDFTNNNLTDVDDLMKIGPSFPTELPNLKRFTCRLGKTEDFVAVKMVTDIIQSAIELEFLHLQYPLEILQQLFESKTNLHKLKHLGLGEMGCKILRVLMKLSDGSQNVMPIQLETFSLSVSAWLGMDIPHEEDEDNFREIFLQTFNKFLAKQSSTLKQLSMWINYSEDFEADDNRMEIPLPRMEQLHTLIISHPWIKFDSGYDHFDPPLSFDYHIKYNTETDNLISTLPKLQAFTYYLQDPNLDLEEVINGDTGPDDPHPGVTSLDINAAIPHLAQLPTLFPSIIHLNLGIPRNKGAPKANVHSFTKIWTLWPTLTHLKLKLEFYIHDKDHCLVPLDQLLAGVATHDKFVRMKTDLNHLIAEDRLTLNGLEELMQRYKNKPGIRDLRQLKELELEWDFGKKGERPAALTDVGAYCGLVLIGPQLQKMVIAKSKPVARISKRCIQFMKSVYSPTARIDFE